MKYIKASICSIAAFSVLPYIQSAENLDPLFAELKRTKDVSTSVVLSESGRKEAIDKGFTEIENRIFGGSPLPNPLKDFYREVGNYEFSVEILSPIQGIESPLHAGIREGQHNKIPSNWVVFAQCTESEYFCINLADFKIARFLVFPEAKPFKQEDTYTDMAAWINKILLRK